MGEQFYPWFEDWRETHVQLGLFHLWWAVLSLIWHILDAVFICVGRKALQRDEGACGFMDSSFSSEDGFICTPSYHIIVFFFIIVILFDRSFTSVRQGGTLVTRQSLSRAFWVWLVVRLRRKRTCQNRRGLNFHLQLAVLAVRKTKRRDLAWKWVVVAGVNL